MEKRNEGKQNLPVQVRTGTAEKLARVFERRRKTKLDTIGAILDWFADADDVIQTMVLGEVDRGMERAYAAALRDIADDLDRRANPPPNTQGRPKRQQQLAPFEPRSPKTLA